MLAKRLAAITRLTYLFRRSSIAHSIRCWTRTEAVAKDPAEALLGVTVIDPACGSGHFLLAAARRIATRFARVRANGVASASDFRHALRDVVRSCIHGVDRNPMAVELTKVALWIETVEPGKPLGFLDANVRCGNSLLGMFNLEALRTGVPDGAYKPLSGDDKETAKYFEKQNKAEREGQGRLDFARGGGNLPPIAPLARDARAVRSLPEDNPAEIATKRARFQAIHSSPRLSALRMAADLYIATFLTPKVGGVPENQGSTTIPTTAHVWQAVTGQLHNRALASRALDLARESCAFHWPLEFPDLMESGGFDVAVGNPPWEVMQLGEEEYFAQRLPEIAELKGVARKRAIANLQDMNPVAFTIYQSDKRSFEAGSEFARASGRFGLTAKGKINTYALFAELFANLTSYRGRAGLIVPTGLITDYTNATFFASIVKANRLVRSLAFDNQKRIFPAIHPDTPFTLLTIGITATTPEFAAYLLTAEHLGEPNRRYTLSAEAIARINPNTNTAPIFRSSTDADLTAKIYNRIPILAPDHSQGGYLVEFVQNFFSTSNKVDAQLFAEAEAMSLDETLPVLRGTMVDQFDHRAATYDDRAKRFRELDPEERETLDLVTRSDKRVPRNEVLSRLGERGWRNRWLLGWRDITNATNERTVISSVFPISGTDDTLSLIFPREGAKAAATLLANLNSLMLDYIAQQKVGGTHIRKYVISQFPVIRFASYEAADFSFILPRVLELTYTTCSMEAFAHDLEYDGRPFGWNEDRRLLIRAELDAWYARAYRLTRDELRYILDPADVLGPDYPSETFRVLKKHEIARFGEYRTARLVLAAWDRMERGEIRDVSPAIAIAETASAQTSIDVSTLPDGAWANPAPSADASLAQVAALIKALPGPTPITHVRLAAIFVLEPRYLSRRLPERERSTWSRLVGHAADLVKDSKVVEFAPSIPADWRSAVTQLLGMRAIVEDSSAHTWAAGPSLDQFAIDKAVWPYGRATFVLQALPKINLDEAVADLSNDDQAWVRASAA